MALRVDWVIAAQQVTGHDRLVDAIGAGIDHIPVAAFPAVVEINLAIRVVGLPDEGKQYDLTVSILNEDKDEVMPPLTGGVVFGQRTSGDPADFETGDVVACTAKVPVEREGVYIASVAIDGDRKRLPIRVHRQ